MMRKLLRLARTGVDKTLPWVAIAVLGANVGVMAGNIAGLRAEPQIVGTARPTQTDRIIRLADPVDTAADIQTLHVRVSYLPLGNRVTSWLRNLNIRHGVSLPVLPSLPVRDPDTIHSLESAVDAGLHYLRSLQPAGEGAPGYAGYRLSGEVTFTPTTRGSSGGLAAALEVIDQLTEGDLGRGLTVAVTGTISPTGVVGPVAGVQYKALSAVQAGADILIVPTSNLAATTPAHDAGVRVVGVTTLAEAVEALGWTHEELAGRFNPDSDILIPVRRSTAP